MNSMAFLHIFIRFFIGLSMLSLYLRYLHERHIQISKNHVEIICGLFLLCFFLFGCMPSLHPLYTEDTLIFDEQLIGKWYDDNGNCWVFSQSDQKEYALRVTGEEGKQALVEAHLVKLGSHRYLDLFPSEEWKEHTFGYTLMPVHNFMRVQMSDPNLQLQWIMFHELIEEDPNILKHELIPEANGEYSEIKFFITAQTEDIQRVIMQYTEEIVEDDEGTFMLKRCPSIFKENDIFFEETLRGQWTSEDHYSIDFNQSSDDSYKIRFREEESDLRFDGVLYRFNERTILGLSTETPSQNENDAGLHLIPDYLLLIEYEGDELKSWHLNWEDMENYKVKDAIYNFDDLKEPDIVFKKKTTESENVKQ